MRRLLAILGLFGGLVQAAEAPPSHRFRQP